MEFHKTDGSYFMDGDREWESQWRKEQSSTSLWIPSEAEEWKVDHLSSQIRHDKQRPLYSCHLHSPNEQIPIFLNHSHSSSAVSFPRNSVSLATHPSAYDSEKPKWSLDPERHRCSPSSSETESRQSWERLSFVRGLLCAQPSLRLLGLNPHHSPERQGLIPVFLIWGSGRAEEMNHLLEVTRTGSGRS